MTQFRLLEQLFFTVKCFDLFLARLPAGEVVGRLAECEGINLINSLSLPAVDVVGFF